MKIKLTVQGEIPELKELHERLEVQCGRYGVSLRDFVYLYYFDIHGPTRLNIVVEQNKNTGE